MSKPFTDPADAETIAEAFARYLASGGGETSCILVMPDGSGFRITPNVNGDSAFTERLSSAEMLAALMTQYGVSAFKVQ